MQVGSVNTLFGYGRVVQRPAASSLLEASARRRITTPFDSTPYRELLRETHRLRDMLGDIRSSFRALAGRSVVKQGGVNSVASANPVGLDLFTTSATLNSSEEINTAPTSFTAFGPNMVGSVVTAPWSGPGSTAEATVSGNYDGSNGSGDLTFRVNREGTHGADNLRINVYSSDGSLIENINIGKNDPVNTVYALSNGLNITLSAGDLVKNEEFTVNTDLLSTSFGPSQPVWTGSTAEATIGGTYDGSQGTGTLTFRATRGGIHGEDDLKVKVYAPDDSFIETIDIKKNDSIDKVYSLSNGLTFTLDAGELIKHETLAVNVDAADPAATNPTQPAWQVSTAEATFGGTYDGSHGSGTITFESTKNGTHGVDDLRIKAFAPDGSLIQNIDIFASDPIGQVYTLSNGLTFTLGAGDLIKNETFTVDLQATTSFSTTPHPVESTAEVTIGGVYDGTQDTGSLLFQTTLGGTHGVDDLSIEVRAPDNTLIETITVLHTDPLDQVYQLSNGLSFQLGSGTLVLNETFNVNVNHQIGSKVNPDKSFDGTRNDQPNFDLGFGVTPGSFDVNGVTISVSASDSINNVLAKINSSAANVMAVFNAATETIDLTSTIPGSTGQIVLSNDTSGFLAATKLEGVVAQPGYDNGTTLPINTVEALSGINDGQFSVNGISINVDTAVDSLDDVIERINQLVPQVSASYDVVDDVLKLQAQPNSTLDLDDGSSGFFSALGIVPKIYEVQSKSGHVSSASREAVIKQLGILTKALNKTSQVASRPQNQAVGSITLGRLWSGIKTAVEPHLKESFKPSQQETDIFGITFSLQGEEEFVTFDSDAVSDAIGRHGGSFFDFFLDEKKGSKPAGLFDALDSALHDQEKALFLKLAEAGVRLVDVIA